jgi:hypothetical protein
VLVTEFKTALEPAVSLLLAPEIRQGLEQVREFKVEATLSWNGAGCGDEAPRIVLDQQPQQGVELEGG